MIDIALCAITMRSFRLAALAGTAWTIEQLRREIALVPVKGESGHLHLAKATGANQ